MPRTKKEECVPKYLPSIEEIYDQAEEIRKGWSQWKLKCSGGHLEEAQIPVIVLEVQGKMLR